MAKREIRLNGEDDVLRKVCKPVKEITDHTIELLDDMVETMYHANGVGLAAPQVGILKRIVVIDVGNGLVELINPVIVKMEGSNIDMEGCLSIPGESAYVERPEYIVVSAQNRLGEMIEVEGEGLMAVALCHELDHLEGVLYIDRAIDENDLEIVNE